MQRRPNEAPEIQPGPAVGVHKKNLAADLRADTVATMPKAQEKEEAFDFEAGLKRLEALVTTMESGDLPLHDLVAKYEEGCKLVKACEKRLKQAERKIEILRETSGEAKTEAFEPEDPS